MESICTTPRSLAALHSQPPRLTPASATTDPCYHSFSFPLMFLESSSFRWAQSAFQTLSCHWMYHFVPFYCWVVFHVVWMFLNLFIQLPFNEHLCCFPYLVVMKKVALKIHEQDFFLSGCVHPFLLMKWGCWVIWISIALQKKLQNSFWKWWFCFSLLCLRVPDAPCSHQHCYHQYFLF